ncbi:MAG: type II toxin-antitoxin system VapC family toxin [Dehalococcoidia bacterium]
MGQLPINAMLTLDTNIVIGHLKDEPGITAVIRAWRTQSKIFFISTITELELLSLPTLNAQTIEEIDLFLKSLHIIPVDSAIARIAADLRRRYRIRTPDSAIAATAIFTQSALVTRDLDHFNLIKELKIESI